MRINLRDFPELSSPGDSVRIGTSPIVQSSPEEIRSIGPLQPIIINRGDGDQFYVLDAACTHQGCSVRRLDPVAQVMVCPCHGSQFRINGEVPPGREQPATTGLLQYDFRLIDDVLEIQIPNEVFWEVDQIRGNFFDLKVERGTPANRLQISFFGIVDLIYEIYFRENLAAPLEKLKFATSPDGALNHEEIPAPSDDFVHIFVERTGRFGFFQIAIKTMEL